MAKMGKGWRRLITFIIIILPVILFININNISYVFLPKYEYLREENAVFGTLKIDSVDYIEITERQYNTIDRELKKEGIYIAKATVVGRIDYRDVDTWKYRIYGNRDIDHRILIRGEEAYMISPNYPEVYFCREDILDLYKESMTEE